MVAAAPKPLHCDDPPSDEGRRDALFWSRLGNAVYGRWWSPTTHIGQLSAVCDFSSPVLCNPLFMTKNPKIGEEPKILNFPLDPVSSWKGWQCALPQMRPYRKYRKRVYCQPGSMFLQNKKMSYFEINILTDYWTRAKFLRVIVYPSGSHPWVLRRSLRGEYKNESYHWSRNRCAVYPPDWYLHPWPGRSKNPGISWIMMNRTTLLELKFFRYLSGFLKPAWNPSWLDQHNSRSFFNP